ncbi:hypothetical protein AWM70_17340 [Paenibacillus yonginensis]|uniref:Uncharacterized protein n=1 Tax=Paenibacillus yonginensis TaxID=1462996 RepID=A0A1B1N3X7_9BACL|nr:DUF5693 family protein [Paenibacillus yonginensis]ANS76130.1 hypothetical protein AWM70_17340 [Paenibacillus yonginensis]
MYSTWKKGNNTTRKWLWILVVVGLVASLPIIYERVETENSAKQVQFVFNYRSLLDISSYQVNQQEALSAELDKLHDSGVNTIAVFESNLDELKKARRIMVYNSQDVAEMNKSAVTAQDNATYIAFTSEDNAKIYAPIIEDGFKPFDIAVTPWSVNGLQGLRLNTSPEDAGLKSLQPDPQALELIHSKGFMILPRMNDNGPYSQEIVDKELDLFTSYGVNRILFDGNAVKGYGDNADKNSLQAFANSLKQRGMGIAVIEGLKEQQKGFAKLAYLLDYNVVRLHSISDTDAVQSTSTLADRIALAVKDRKIRMVYLNASPSRNPEKATITDPIDNLIHTLQEPGNAISRVQKDGFQIGTAEAFDVVDHSWEKAAKLFVVLGAVAFTAMMISLFLPSWTLAMLILGLLGSAGLYVLKPTLLEQMLALAAAISAPTVATILAIRKVKELGAAHPGMSASRRLSHSLVLFIKSALISLSAVPFVVGLLNNITYALVLNQFRGVSLLHAVPMLLVAIYVFLYQGESVLAELRRWLRMPITVFWVVIVAIIGIAGLYYLSRTGNSGSLLPGEASFRAFLENTIGVRPRNKEFLFAHPLFIVGVFASLRYPKVLYIMIIAAIGQLSMVDTFAHIHSPFFISLIRGLLGLGFGLIVGLVFVLIWQILERCWKKWSPLLLEK